MVKTLRERFCNHKRRLNRRVMRYLAITAIVLLAIGNLQHWNSKKDREKLHAEIAEIRKQAEMTRLMLDSRTISQTTTIQAVDRANLFTGEEKIRLSEIWIPAEYNLVVENPFKK